MKLHILVLSLLFSVSGWSQTTNLSVVEAMLDIDRFHSYSQSWALTMSGRGKKEIAEAILSLKPTEIPNFNFKADKLKDAFHYDDLILEILNNKHPRLKATKEEVAWGYDFYKRKINDGYKVTAPSATMDPKPASVITPGHSGGVDIPVVGASAEDVLLNVDTYVASRTTRGVFWEASQSNRKIELHVGSAGDFKSNLAARGAKVLGEVRTHGNNYNPIFIVQDPGAKNFHYAVTEISGADRLKHFQMQSALVRWEGKSGKLAPPPPIHVVGDAIAQLKKEEAALTQVLKVIPKADHVLIGQKGAFERTIGSLGKIQAILELNKKNPESIKTLKPEFVKLIEKAQEGKESLSVFVMKNASQLDKLYEAAKPILSHNKINLAPVHTVYNLDKGTYEVSDYLLQGADGKPQRWRVFSNVWGDEVLPVAEALKATGHKDIFYVGTAGGLPDSSLKVGDLVVPEKSHDVEGKVRKLNSKLFPEGAKKIDMVTHVSSPFEETHEWLADRKKIAQAVEVETGYLAKVFNAPDDKLNMMLLISDMVGVEGETLAEASSAVRRKSQINALSFILDQAKVTRPVAASLSGDKLSTWIDEIAPNRDPVSKFQIYKEAEHQGISTRETLNKFMEAEKSFTSKRLLTSIDEAEFRLARVLDDVVEGGLRPEISISRNFIEGRWNPASGPIEVHLSSKSPEIEKQLKELLVSFHKQDKSFSKFIQISVGNVDGESKWIKLPGFLDSPDGTLLNLYKDSALGFGGLASTETRTGNLKFVQVAPPSPGRATTNLAYFPPDEKTEILLKSFKTSSPKALEKFLLSKIDEINNSQRENWEIRLKKVDKIPNGSLAVIVPELGSEKLYVDLLITPEGLKNPAVVMEEYVHLRQLQFVPVWDEYKFTSFQHPYQWAETVANAKAGSPRAMEKLARMELEAIRGTKNVLELFSDYMPSAEDYEKYLTAREAHAESIYKDVAKSAKLDFKKREEAWGNMKKVFDQMEKEPVKFNDLVMNNDRKGVRDMLEKYLPWDIMEPSEKNAWKIWLEAIENPDKKNLKLVFRGLDDDQLLKSLDDRPGVLSTVLSKNQGNYTRRLRSLTTMRDRFGVYKPTHGEHLVVNQSNPPSLLKMMSNHAYEPVGSPFLSTSHHSVTTSFGSTRRGAFLIDDRRLVPNAMAFNYLHEREKLVPLVIFPDELVYFEDASKTGSGFIDNEKFIKNVEKKFGKKLEFIHLNGLDNDRDFVVEGYKRIKELYLEPSNLPAITGCSLDAKSCECVFKTLNALLK